MIDCGIDLLPDLVDRCRDVDRIAGLSGAFRRRTSVIARPDKAVCQGCSGYEARG